MVEFLDLQCPILISFCRLSAEQSESASGIFSDAVTRDLEEMSHRAEQERVSTDTVQTRAFGAMDQCAIVMQMTTTLSFLQNARYTDTASRLWLFEDYLRYVRKVVEDVTLLEVEESLSGKRPSGAAMIGRDFNTKQKSAGVIILGKSEELKCGLDAVMSREYYALYGDILHQVCTKMKVGDAQRLRVIGELMAYGK